MSEPIEDLEGIAEYYVHGTGNAIVGLRNSMHRHHRLDLPDMAENARTIIAIVSGSLDTLPVGRNPAGDELVAHTRAYLDSAERYLNGEIPYEKTEADYAPLVDRMRAFRDAFERVRAEALERGETTTTPSLVHGTFEYV